MRSKRKQVLFELDRGTEFYNNIFQNFSKKKISKLILETHPLEPFLQKDLIALLDIFLKEQFLKKVMLNGLMFYPQNPNNIVID